MISRKLDYTALVKEVRKQRALSQEDLARELGISYTTINRWGNGQSKPSKMAKILFNVFYEKMIDASRLALSTDLSDSANIRQRSLND